jgi:alpha-beta hydrolase superfamily lysophospholipase
MQKTTVGKLSVWRHAATGEPFARVLVLHGLGEHSWRHRNTIEHLTKKGVEVVRFDFRGAGESGGERQWIDRFDDYVEDVLAVQRWIGVEQKPLPLFVLGHSLGGAIAIHSAPSLDGSIRGILLDAPAFEPGAGVSKVKIAVGKVINKIAPHVKIPDALDVKALSRDPAVSEAFVKDPLCCHFNTVRQGNEILKALEEIPSKCREIKVPVLITHGDSDRIIKPAGSTKILESLSSQEKTLEVFPGAYHELHNDLCKEDYFKMIVPWIRAHA